MISIIELFALKGKEIGIHNIDKIFYNIHSYNKNITNINLKNILRQATNTKNERLRDGEVEQSDLLPLFNFNDIKEQILHIIFLEEVSAEF